MTEKLRMLMHEQADAADLPTPDVAHLIDAGERRLRRRRAATGVAGLAATAAMVTAIAVLTTGSDEPSRGMEVAAPPMPTNVVTYAKGEVIYAGDEEVDVGAPIRAFVRTSIGYVAVNPGGQVLSVVGSSRSQVGVVDPDQIRLVSDPDGTLAGWVQTDGERPAFVVLDQSNGSVTTNDDETTIGQPTLADAVEPAYFYAIDEGAAYWRDSRGAVAFDVATGEAKLIKPGARNGFDVADAEAGQVAFAGDDRDVAIGPTFDDIDLRLRLKDSGGTVGRFSPDGEHLSLDADSPEVFNLASGESVSFSDLPGYFATGYDWLDADTVLMISLASPQSPAEVWSCSVSTGSCEATLDDLASISDFEQGKVVLPVGEPID